MVIYVVLTCRSLRTTGVSPTLLLKFFMLSGIPRTSPPFAGIRSLPINPVLLSPSDYIGFVQKQNAPLKCSSPCCDLMSPEPAAFLQLLTPLTDCLCCATVKSVNSNHLGVVSWLYTKRQSLLCIFSTRVQDTNVKASQCWIAVGEESILSLKKLGKN